MRDERLKIKRFDLLDLYLHEEQFPYLGRCHALPNTNEANLTEDIAGRELNELFLVIFPAWYGAVSEAFGEFKPIIEILGERWPHINTSLIPRFEGTRHFYGIDFVDPNPKENYQRHSNVRISLDVLLDIKENIRVKLEKYELRTQLQ